MSHALAEERIRPAEAAQACCICGNSSVEPLLPERLLPLYCNVLWADRDRAVAAARGALRLSICTGCSHVRNEAFRPELLNYTPAYENSLHYSQHFRGYAHDLARSLVEKYSLRGRFIVDVGCGRGDFLELVCRLGSNRGRGYDRSCPPDAAAITDGLDLVFVGDFFSRTTVLPPIDLLTCRQVLEHISDPAAFLAEIVASPSITEDTVLFFEVPNAAYTLEGDGIWDLIYEHCSYFTERSLVTIFERCGLEVIATRDLYSGQYLGIEARRARDADTVGSMHIHSTHDVAASFAARYRAKLSRWQESVAGWSAAGERIVIWGAGSKGVSFLDALMPTPIAYAVDLNPRKHGRFLPGSGAEVVSPEFLMEYRPHRVILMNAVYQVEIADLLARLGQSPALVAA
jgi:2-polyprenyl-3-methyl-5-hydroxy-6-metoxy-1,4-benzoquinol methylase